MRTPIRGGLAAGGARRTVNIAPRNTTTGQPAASPAPAATPLVRQLADRLGVNLAAVTGTGAGGRIRRDDVFAAAGPARQSLASVERAAAPAAAAPVDPMQAARNSEAYRNWPGLDHLDPTRAKASTHPSTQAALDSDLYRDWPGLDHLAKGRR